MSGLMLIGPHEGREFELLETGEKEVALFYEIIPEELDDFLRRDKFEGIFFDRTILVGGEKLSAPYVIVFSRGNEVLAEELKLLLEKGPTCFDPDIERRIGEILGYPEEAINHYIRVSSPSDND